MSAMNYIDLHMHSTHSDGTMTPRQLIIEAEMRGLKAVSITDHDTITQVPEALKHAEGRKVEVISGVEVSADFPEGTMHILGYFFDCGNKELNEMLDKYREGREERNPKIIKNLQKLGCQITYDEVESVAEGNAIGRPHIAKIMIRHGFVSSSYEAFAKYLKKGAPAYEERLRFSSAEIIDTLHKAGGLVFLAHPKQLHCRDTAHLREVVDRVVSEGIDGIEVYNSCHRTKDIKLYEKLAKEKGLLMSAGSDFHGKNREFADMSYVGAGIEVDYDMIEKMKERLKQNA